MHFSNQNVIKKLLSNSFLINWFSGLWFRPTQSEDISMMVTNHKLNDNFIPGIYMFLTIFPYIAYLCIFISCGLFILTVLQTYEFRLHFTIHGFMQYSNTYFELIYVSIDQVTNVGG